MLVVEGAKQSGRVLLVAEGAKQSGRFREGKKGERALEGGLQGSSRVPEAGVSEKKMGSDIE